MICYPLERGSGDFFHKGFAGQNGLLYNSSTLLLYERNHKKYINEWVWLCYIKTLFTKTGGRPDLAVGHSLLTPGLELCCLVVRAGPLPTAVSVGAK